LSNFSAQNEIFGKLPFEFTEYYSQLTI